VERQEEVTPHDIIDHDDAIGVGYDRAEPGDVLDGEDMTTELVSQGLHTADLSLLHRYIGYIIDSNLDPGDPAGDAKVLLGVVLGAREDRPTPGHHQDSPVI
jgi:hypothetical protein